ncbi:MAG: HAMP domain-containing protein [Gammaproteobacteria bacterium]|nr:HAMP domain-containing protein [Gammaproteobacteria bacterium]
MAIATLKRLGRSVWPMLLLFFLLLVSLSFMNNATHNSTQFDESYLWLLLTNVIGIFVLILLIGINLYWLARQYRQRVAGARLTVRMVLMFVTLSVAPVSVVYYFSLQSLQTGIDSWFDVRVEDALQDSLELSRSSFDLRLRDMLSMTEKMAIELKDVAGAMAPLGLYDLRVRSGAQELTILGDNGRIIASSSVDIGNVVPSRPTDSVLLQVHQGYSYVGLDPMSDSGLHVRAVVLVPRADPLREGHILQALYLVPDRFSRRAESVQKAFSRYKELAFLRESLKYSYILTLSLVLLLSLLSAVWGAFYLARKMVAPIRDLAEGTRAVAEGQYDKRLPVPGNDELGFLVTSFNEMTARLSRARDDAHKSQLLVEGQRAYLEMLLASISSGVMSFSADFKLAMVNDAAEHILGVQLKHCIGEPIDAIQERYPFLLPLMELIYTHGSEGELHWDEEVVLQGDQGRRVCLCRGARQVQSGLGDDGQVIVFDDVTSLLQAQRDAAWSEVARRLAHEIKNPLTPIQLSAERLRHKYLAKMDPADAEVLDRATHTIVQQVEAMKTMVNAFSEYARTPHMQKELLDLNVLLLEVVDLYQVSHSNIGFEVDLDAGTCMIQADALRIRQLAHNLIKNAIEANSNNEHPHVWVSGNVLEDQKGSYVELLIKDDGPGFSDALMEDPFEPYVTTKHRGTGLGLAIVKKIVEEHGGMIYIKNRSQGGAQISVRFQLADL